MGGLVLVAAVGAHQHAGHHGKAAEGGGDHVAHHIAVVVLAGPDEAALAADDPGHRVVDEGVEVLDARSLELLLVLRLVDLGKDVLEGVVVLLADGVLGGEPQVLPAVQGELEAGVGEGGDGGHGVELALKDAGARKVADGLADRLPALRREDQLGNGMVTIVDQSFQEVQSYLLETNHIIATLEIIANKTTMDSLTEEQQQIVRDAAKAAAVQAWDDYIASIDEDRATIEEAGVTVTQLSDEERQKMIDAIQPTIDTLLEENADWAPALIEKINAVQ